MNKPRVDLHYDVVNLILQKGSVADRLRLIAAGFDRAADSLDDVLAHLEHLLNPDGGLPFALRPGNPSSVKETAEVLALLAPFKERCPQLVERMVSFLVSRQKADGGFAETLNLNPLIEDRWGSTTGREWYPVGKSITWLTGKALEALCLVGYDDIERLRRARDFLMYSQHEDGHWPDYKGQDVSDPLGTGHILPALRAVGVRPDHKVYRNGRAAMLQHLKSAVENGSYADMVDLASVGPPEDELEKNVIERGMELIVASQNKDGGWCQPGTRKSDPELSSILAFILKKCCHEQRSG